MRALLRIAVVALTLGASGVLGADQFGTDLQPAPDESAMMSDCVCGCREESSCRGCSNLGCFGCSDEECQRCWLDCCRDLCIN